MIEEIKKKTTNNLDSHNLKESYLSIQLSLDGFSFCIYNSYSTELIAFSSYKFNEENSISPQAHLKFVKSVFEKENILNNEFKRVSVAHFNNLVAQVPKPFFDETKLPEYLKYTVKTLKNDYITFDEIANTDITNVYIPFVNINNFFIEKYGSFTFKHSSTIFIEGIVKQYKNSDKNYCFVNVNENQFELLVLKNAKVELFNSFTYTTKEDFIYFILFTAEQLDLNPEEFELILLGEIESKSELYTTCYQYIRNVSFFKNSNFPKLLKHQSEHTNFILLNQF